MDKPIRTNNQDDIIYKEEERLVSVAYCPVCKEELRESGKFYRPLWCKCGDWYWDEDDETYNIFK